MKCNELLLVGLPFDPVKSIATIRLICVPPYKYSKNEGFSINYTFFN